jgi:hypothetical protein
MKIEVKRTAFNETNTLGEMSIDGVHFCYTVEDKVRDYNNDGDLDDKGEEKVYGETAIPKGEYKVILSMSNRFKRILPEVLNVKGFAGIRIHNGNTALDSHGCLIVGYKLLNDGVAESRKATEDLVKKLTGVKDITIYIA